MKLFSSERFTKPGKGVDKNEKPKPGFIRFFIVLWNKRNKILGINFLNFLFGIPAFIIAGLVFAGSVAFYDVFDQTVNISEMISQPGIENEFYFRFILFAAMLLTCIPVFSSGPLYAGFTYIIKSFYKEEPVFLWHDYITKTRTNLNLGLKTMVMNMLAGTLIMFNMSAYMVISNSGNERFSGIPYALLFVIALVTIFFFVLLLMMNLYMYPMMVTFNLTFKQMIRNTFVLCMVKWLPSIGILLLDIILIGVPVFLLPTQNYIVFVFCLVLYAAILPAFISLINMFFVYSVFKKYLIDNPNADRSGKVEEPEETLIIPEKKTGHFENGMWINDADEEPALPEETEDNNVPAADDNDGGDTQ